jgi:hypothetical protein
MEKHAISLAIALSCLASIQLAAFPSHAQTATGAADPVQLVGNWEGLWAGGVKYTLTIRAASTSSIEGDIAKVGDRSRRLRRIEVQGPRYIIAVGDTSRLEVTLLQGGLTGQWCNPQCSPIELRRQ